MTLLASGAAVSSHWAVSVAAIAVSTYLPITSAFLAALLLACVRQIPVLRGPEGCRAFVGIAFFSFTWPLVVPLVITVLVVTPLVSLLLYGFDALRAEDPPTKPEDG